MRRSALIVATGTYTDERLRRLHSPAQDAGALAAVLRDEERGGFEVETLLDSPDTSLRRQLSTFFKHRARDDLLLLYLSCHGVQNEDGQLYFAAVNTDVDHLEATAISSEFVNRLMNRSLSRKIVLLLDCCYSGAFGGAALAKSDSDVHLPERFDGRGRVVLTASTSTQYAFESHTVHGLAQPSVFTAALVEGIRNGSADRDEDGEITLDELYDHIVDAISDSNPDQVPRKWAFDVQGDLYIAKSTKRIDPFKVVAPGLGAAVRSPYAHIRAGAVHVLVELLAAPPRSREERAAAALLELLAGDDSRTVSAAATAALGGHVQRGAEPDPESKPEPEPEPAPTPKRAGAPEPAPEPKRAGAPAGAADPARLPHLLREAARAGVVSEDHAPPAAEKARAAQRPGAARRRRAQDAPRVKPGDVVCTQCGSGNSPARKFCTRCGSPLADARIASTPSWSILRGRISRRRQGIGFATVAIVTLGGLAIAKWLFGWLNVTVDADAPALDDVQCTVFAPPAASPGRTILVQVFAHLPEEADDARAIATELDVRALRRAFRSLEAPVAVGSRLDFELRVPGLDVDDPVASFTWRGRTEAVQFGVHVPPTAPAGTVIGTVAISREGIPVGHVKFTLAIAAAAGPAAEPQGIEARRYRFAFVSYASQDRDEVLRRVQMLSVAGVRYFQDVLDLDPGEVWSAALEEAIRDADVFLLFWSSRAKESGWVRKEVDFALACKAGDELSAPEIRPVIIEGPPVIPPWDDLAHLHFNDRVLYFMSRPR